MNDYVPRRGLRNGHAMTVYCWARRRTFPRLPAPTERAFRRRAGNACARALLLAAGRPLPARCCWRCTGSKDRAARTTCAGSPTRRSRAASTSILLNQRNCGGTEHLAETLYHSGLTHDADRVIHEIVGEGIERVVVAGYSLGGNLALKLAGDYGDAPPAALRGVCAVSPVLELGACVRALERRQNFAYQWNFVRGLKARMRRKALTHPGRFPVMRLADVRTVRQFDEVFTAPQFGFDGAEDYYHRASAMRVIDRIRVPTLIITAEDDPFVPTEPFRDPSLTGNPHITLRITPHGGHCGFISDSTPDDDGYWAEQQVVAFAAQRVKE